MTSIGDSSHSHNFNLDFDPFDQEQLVSHFFPGGNRQVLLDQLTESCSYSSDLVVVTGSLGSGKSTLAHWLALNLDDDFVAVTVRATLFMSAEQLLEAVCDELTLETVEGASIDELVEQLDQYAESLRARSKTLQLLVDDAHELGEEALQAILELLERQADSSRLGEDGVKVVMFGESVLITSIQQLLPSAHTTFELEPLATEEVVDYVAFKLACADYHGKFPLDIDVMTVIEARSQGIPGAIDAMVKDELGGSISRRAGLLRRLQPDLGFLERHLVAASVLFGALLLMLFFTLDGDENTLDAGFELAGSNSGTAQAGDNGQRIQVPLELSSALNRQAALDQGSAPEPGAGTGENAGRSVTRFADSSTAVLEHQQSAPAESATAVVVDATATSTTETAVDAPQVAATGSHPVSSNGASQLQLREAERALLSESPAHYTLQLLGSHSEDSVKSFIASNSIPAELSYFESRHQDRPWFVVVHGSYPDRDAAREAIDRLPPPLRELQPWARSLSDIQADIRSLE